VAKGGDFERSFSKELSVWWGGKDDIFWHTCGSGARATVRNKRGKDAASQFGDIFATDEAGKMLEDNWSIELKTGYAVKSSKKLTDKNGKQVKILNRWDLLDLLDSAQATPKFDEFWNQAKRDAELSHRTPVLVFRRNLRTPCIAFSRGYFNKLVDCFGFPEFEVIQVGKRVCILSLRLFFQWIPDVRAALKVRG